MWSRWCSRSICCMLCVCVWMITFEQNNFDVEIWWFFLALQNLKTLFCVARTTCSCQRTSCSWLMDRFACQNSTIYNLQFPKKSGGCPKPRYGKGNRPYPNLTHSTWVKMVGQGHRSKFKVTERKCFFLGENESGIWKAVPFRRL